MNEDFCQAQGLSLKIAKNVIPKIQGPRRGGVRESLALQLPPRPKHTQTHTLFVRNEKKAINSFSLSFSLIQQKISVLSGGGRTQPSAYRK